MSRTKKKPKDPIAVNPNRPLELLALAGAKVQEGEAMAKRKASNRKAAPKNPPPQEEDERKRPARTTAGKKKPPPSKAAKKPPAEKVPAAASLPNKESDQEGEDPDFRNSDQEEEEERQGDNEDETPETAETLNDYINYGYSSEEQDEKIIAHDDLNDRKTYVENVEGDDTVFYVNKPYFQGLVKNLKKMKEVQRVKQNEKQKRIMVERELEDAKYANSRQNPEPRIKKLQDEKSFLEWTDLHRKDHETTRVVACQAAKNMLGEYTERYQAAKKDFAQTKDKLTEEVTRLTTLLTRAQEEARAGVPAKIAAASLNKDLVHRINKVVTQFLFRTIKFLEDDKDCTEATLDTYNLVEEVLPAQMDKEMFMKEYRGSVATAFNTARQYVQSEGKKVAENFSKTADRIPTVGDIEKMWTISTQEQLNLEENTFSRAVMLWYYDKWLPVVAGKHWWNANSRYYKLPTDHVNVNGENKPTVSQTSEAFGLLVLDNYWSKWTAIIDWKKDHEYEKVPTTAPDNAPFKAKWSQAASGQVRYGGWDAEAYAAFEKYQDAVEEHRRVDKANDYSHMKLAKQKIRQRYNITEDEPGKKRRRAKAAAASQMQVPRKIRRREK